MSVSEAAALTTRSRSRSSSAKALHIHPEEELAKHDSRSKANLRISSSHIPIENPTIYTRSHEDHHHHHHLHDPSRDAHTHDMSAQPKRSKSKGKPLLDSSTREPTVSLSTHRVISYGPSSDDLILTGQQISMDSIQSLDGAHSTETQTSSKTIPQDADTDIDTMKPSPPSSPHTPLEVASLFFTKDVLLHILSSLIVLGLVVLVISQTGMPATHRLIRTFKGANIFSWWTRPSLATSHQVQELKEHLMLTLKVSTERLEERVEGLKAEMREEMKRRKEETKEIREEMSKDKPPKEANEDEKNPYVHGHGYDGGLISGMTAVGRGGRPDYALASGGGRIVGHSATYKPTSSASWIDRLPTSLFIRSARIHPLASIILQPSFHQPGQCLPLASSNVHVEVALRTPIFPEQVTLSHVSKSIAYDISSAPREFHIYGLPPPLSTKKPANWIRMGEFTYDVHKPLPAQTFPLWDTAHKTLVSTIKLHVLSNYGSPSHTCIYRLQVHGKEPPSSSLL